MVRCGAVSTARDSAIVSQQFTCRPPQMQFCLTTISSCGAAAAVSKVQ